ncbi:hypothetical protein KC340_g18054, partial [Hortaea werneckii]
LFETELQSLHSRQQPFPDGSPKPPTLIACLRRTFAEKTGVAFAETEGKMWEVLSSLEMGVDGTLLYPPSIPIEGPAPEELAPGVSIPLSVGIPADASGQVPSQATVVVSGPEAGVVGVIIPPVE